SLLSVLPGHAGAVLSVAFSADSQRFVSGGSDGTVRVWNVAGGSVVLRGHTDQVVSAAFDATGSCVLSVSQDGSARIWDLPIQAGDRSSSMRSAALNPDAARLVVN